MQLKWTRRAQMINKTRYVALPLAWCEQHNIDRHTPIMMLLRQDGKLVLMPEMEVLHE